jgi:hypothetical protein
MKKFQNIQFSSPETDRKIMLVVSAVFMFLVWIAIVGLCIFSLIQNPPSDGGNWSAGKYLGGGIVVLMLVLIPIQLWCYFREWRKINSD